MGRTGLGRRRLDGLGMRAVVPVLVLGLPASAVAQDPGHYATFAGASADGKRAFVETTEPLVAADRDNRVDLYRRSGRDTTLLSRGEINGNGNFGAFFAGASADGTVVLLRTAERLSPSDNDGAVDIYRRAAGTISLSSIGEINGDGPFDAQFPTVSGDGERVFFHSQEPLVPGDTDAATDVYERSAGTTRLVSAGEVNGDGPFDADLSTVSGDGELVFFHSEERLVPGDTDAARDLYERSAGTTRLVSAGEINGNGEFEVFFHEASFEGSSVFFSTFEQLVPGDGDAASDIYERSAGTTRLVSAGEINGNADLGADLRGISADGARAFFDTAEQLVPTDADAATDVYERTAGTTSLVSVGEINGNGNLGAVFAGASADGTRLFFRSAEQLVAADTDNRLDIYRRASEATTLISTGPSGGNGSFPAELRAVSGDGARALFSTFEPLVLADTDENADVYRRAGDATTLVTRGNANTSASFVGASDDATRVFFTTSEALVPRDWDDAHDLYERSRGRTRLLSRETVRPQTRIADGPGRRTSDRRPTFRLRSSEKGSSFRCRVDNARTRCDAATRLRRLALGRHSFRAQAVDPSGNVDGSPARRVFRVIR